MTNRPAIPAEILRQILIESGHRCAVCGAGCPLERAHIIPWHKSKEHKAEDLVCLCASCHERADLEGWGEKTLREYKKNPWILRQSTEKLAPGPKARLQLTIDMEISAFDESHFRLLQYALAGFLNIPPDAVRLISAEESNSVKVTLEISSEDARRLLSAFKAKDPLLREYLVPFNPIDLQISQDRFKLLDRLRGSVRKHRSKEQEADRLVPAFQAAEILGVSYRTILYLAKTGQIKSRKRGRLVYFRKSDLTRTLQSWNKETIENLIKEKDG